MTLVTCRLLIIGLVVLAVFLPLAIAPPVFVLSAPLVSATIALDSPAHSPAAPLLAAKFLRGPPSL